MVQPNIGESGSKSAATALELCPRLKLTSRTEISCAAAKYPQLIYIFESFKIQLFSLLPVSNSYMECLELGIVNTGYFCIVWQGFEYKCP